MKGVLLDANLLCLLVVGSVDIAAIARHARLKIFGADDYVNLTAILELAGDPILCPHVLAETSNLIAYREGDRSMLRYRRSLAHIVTQCDERSGLAVDAVADMGYERLGLTDAILLLLAANSDVLLVSDDLQLCLEADKRRLRYVNYNYVREGALRIDQIH